MPTEGWALVLTGERFDLDDIREQLRPPYDPWVESYEGGDGSTLLLRSKSWASMSISRDVLADAARLVEHLNASMLLSFADAKPVQLGQIMKFRADGSLEPIIVVGTANITLGAARVRGRGSLGSQDSEKQGPSPVQKRIAFAATSDYASDALAFLSRANNWFDLFKAMESLEALLPDKARQAKALFKGWGDVRRTANHARHSPAKWEPLPDPPPTFDEARALVVEAARSLITGCADQHTFD